MENEIIISQIIMLAIVALIGVLAARFGVLTQISKDMLSKVVFNISLPLMLFTNFLKLKSTPELLTNSFTVFILSGFVIFFMLLVGWLTSRIFGIKEREGAIFKAHSMFGNTIFLGFPLIFSLWGAEALLYASMYQFISTIIMWSVGVVILTREKGISLRKSISRVLNINTLAILVGFTFFVFSVPVPKLIVKPLTELGSANTWLSMLYIGAMLYFADVKGLLGKRSIYLISINRLIIVPALLICNWKYGTIFASIPGEVGYFNAGSNAMYGNSSHSGKRVWSRR
jgi:malate permease and related proteins